MYDAFDHLTFIHFKRLINTYPQNELILCQYVVSIYSGQSKYYVWLLAKVSLSENVAYGLHC